MANLRLPGRSALTLAPPLSTTNIRARARRAPATSSPLFHADVRPPMSRVWAERADRRPNRLQGRTTPSPRQRKPGDGLAPSQILVPPPVLHSQIRFPPEYPDGFTTFTPSIATAPCPHTSVTAPPSSLLLSRPVEDCEGCPTLAGVRNLGLDDPSAGRPGLHCNFGDRRIRAGRAAAARSARPYSSRTGRLRDEILTINRRIRTWPGSQITLRGWSACVHGGIEHAKNTLFQLVA